MNMAAEADTRNRRAAPREDRPEDFHLSQSSKLPRERTAHAYLDARRNARRAQSVTRKVQLYMPVKIDELLRAATHFGASDLHCKAGSQPFMRIGGELRPVASAPRLTQEDTLDMAFSMMSNRQKQRFKEANEADIAYGVSGLGRFRANIFQQRGTVGMVLRVIPDRVRSITELGLPPVVERIAEEQRGLILVTGTTGSGKSTTLAAMIDYINSTRGGHIITIEDPIEFLHRDKKSFVTQREVDVDTRSFAEALRGALRQDPDVILVGEMRDHETIETALTAAETGHLVLSTLHTLDATETVRRIVSSFTPHLQKSVRIQLGGILKAVISMRLIRSDEGAGRVPAAEVMVSTGLIRDYIINEEKTSQIRDAISAGTSQYGMQTFDQSLFALHHAGLISMEEALRGASNPDEFRLRVAGIRSASDQAKEDMERVTTVSNTTQPRSQS
jgi:twitching motility protein PilT